MSSDPRTAGGGSRQRVVTRAAASGLNDDRSLWAAVTRVAEVGQQLLLDRFELARLETREDMSFLSRNILFVFAAFPVLLLGWTAFWAGLVVVIHPAIPVTVSLIVLGLLHVVLGGVGTYIGISRLRPEREEQEESTERTGARHPTRGSLPEPATGERAGG